MPTGMCISCKLRLFHGDLDLFFLFCLNLALAHACLSLANQVVIMNLPELPRQELELQYFLADVFFFFAGQIV